MALLVAITPVFAWAIWGALRDADNDLFAWVDDRMPAKQTFSDFCRGFGRQDLAIVSWPGCKLNDPRLPGLAAQLSSSADAAYFERITTGEELLRKLTAPPFDLPRSRVLISLVGNVIGPDRQTSCLILTLSKHGVENRARSVASIYSAADRVDGLDSKMLRLGGPAVEIAAFTDESVRSPVMLWGIAVVFIAIVSCVLLRRFLLSALVVGVAVLNGAFSVAIVYFAGNGMNAVLMPMPTLVMVLSVSCSVHVVNYYREATRADCADTARSTLESAWLPCVLSAVTTAIGLTALVTSDTPPVREFGFYSAISVLLGTAVTLLILPSSLARYFGPAAATTRPPWLHHTWPRLVAYVIRFRWLVVLSGSIVVCSVGLRRLDTSVTLPSTFSARTQVVNDAAWLEERVRPLSQVEVLLVFDKSCRLSSVRRLTLVGDVARAVRQNPHLHATLSLADFLPRPRPAQFGLSPVVP